MSIWPFRMMLAFTTVAMLATHAPAQSNDRPPTLIVLAGDSTVTDKAGWGRSFAACFRDNVRVVNLSRGGRSSRSFRDEGRWRQVLDAQPDYVLIQFGHNDQPGKGPERETDPQTSYRDNLRRYVDEVREIGGQPVLVTSLARRRWTDEGQWTDSGLQPYVDAVRAVAAEKDVPVVDLFTQSIEAYRSLGREACDLISPVNGDGGIDQTHLNEAGGLLFGTTVADMLRRAVPELEPSYQGYREPTPDPRAGRSKEHPLTHGRVEAPTPKGRATLTVAADGSGDFRTVQEAVAAVPDNNSDRTIIDIRPGVYYGPIVVGPEKVNVTFRGHGVDQTILTYALNVRAPMSENQPYYFNGSGVTIMGDDFLAENLTFRNNSGDSGQAMALRIQGDRGVVRNCRLLGWQDTLLTHSKRQYFEDCTIEGRVDFIYGRSTVVFNRCTIRSKNGGYVTASSAPQEQPFGMVFIDCRLTSDDGVPTYLGRPWRPYASVTYLSCDMGAHIRPEGWDNWRNPDNEKTARYAEYRSTGPGANPHARVPWSRQLTDEEASKMTIESILGGEDGWNPVAP